MVGGGVLGGQKVEGQQQPARHGDEGRARRDQQGGPHFAGELS
jgi:hypothetical protein